MQGREQETLDWCTIMFALQVAINDDYLRSEGAAAGNQESILSTCP